MEGGKNRIIRIMKGEYDYNTLYMCVKLSEIKINLIFLKA